MKSVYNVSVWSIGYFLKCLSVLFVVLLIVFRLIGCGIMLENFILGFVCMELVCIVCVKLLGIVWLLRNVYGYFCVLLESSMVMWFVVVMCFWGWFLLFNILVNYLFISVLIFLVVSVVGLSVGLVLCWCVVCLRMVWIRWFWWRWLWMWCVWR